MAAEDDDEGDVDQAPPINVAPWWFTTEFLGWTVSLVALVIGGSAICIDLLTAVTEVPPAAYAFLGAFAAVTNPKVRKLGGGD